ncbi:ATP-binding cassette domain-containing protein [Solwaraspora sp. WMMD1047]|uniref:ATP-binding cassette domain-containing protein n=1 Tax=Solwaraspora sp. WMMD1047 TaxID=3016102 RepID=UPI0024168F92|nr:ATP-binding cassette domain-containing protein [Solwaraspora sp. WMMD1047]MDG4834855.1 ATP-binding cassette domain-containing protein [Solwaraspora sp. WMMD1047]
MTGAVASQRPGPQIPPQDPARLLAALPQGLAVINLTVARRRGPELVVHALCVPPGERHAVLGPAGAGTTLLLDLVHGTRHPTGGRICWAGEDVTDQPVTRRARWLGRTHHKLSLVRSWSCLDNVLLGEQDPAVGQLASGLRLLDQIGLAGHADEPAGWLGLGQQRLLDVAVAVAGRPDLLLLDDPAAGLTDRDLRCLGRLLDGLPTSTAVLLTGHDTRLLGVVDWVTILRDGRRQASGTPADVEADPAIDHLRLCREQR